MCHIVVVCPMFDGLRAIIDSDPLNVLSFGNVAGARQCVEVVHRYFGAGDGKL